MSALNCFKNVLGVFHFNRSVKARPSRLFRRSKGYWNATRTIASVPDDWDTLDRFDRVEFYPDDPDDRVNLEAIMWKPLRWLRRSGRSKAIPEIITLLQQSRIHSARMAPLIIERKSIYYSWWRWSRSRVWALFETRESPWHRVRRDSMSSWNSSSFSTPENREKAHI